VESGRDFSTLSLAEWRAFSDLFAADVQSAVTPAASVARKQTPQSTHPAAVASALTAFRAWSAPLIGV
jgi:argininosuccinate lyase